MSAATVTSEAISCVLPIAHKPESDKNRKKNVGTGLEFLAFFIGTLGRPKGAFLREPPNEENQELQANS